MRIRRGKRSVECSQRQHFLPLLLPVLGASACTAEDHVITNKHEPTVDLVIMCPLQLVNIYCATLIEAGHA